MPRNTYPNHKIKKHTFRGFKYLVFLGIFLAVLAAIFVIYKYKEFIYPELHRQQTSPKEFVEQKSKNLPYQVQKPEVIEHGSRYQHKVALTFDADMTPGMLGLLQKGIVRSWYNRPIKDTLDQEHVKATIFLGGLWAQAYPKEAKELAEDPLIEIGNHSFAHPAFAKNCYKLPVIDNHFDENEVLSAQTTIANITGVTPKYFRFPGGCYDKIDVETIAKLGLKIIHWDVGANVGFHQNSALIIRKVESQVQNGSIVVFHIHDGPYAPKTNDALVKIIPYFKKQGYQFVTISELISE